MNLVLLTAAKVDAQTHLGAVGLAFGALSSPFRMTITGPGNCSGTFPVAPAFGVLGGQQLFPPPVAGTGHPEIPIPAIPLTWDSQFVIPHTKFIDIGLGGTITIEWPNVNPTPLVRTDLAR